MFFVVTCRIGTQLKPFATWFSMDPQKKQIQIQQNKLLALCCSTLEMAKKKKLFNIIIFVCVLFCGHNDISATHDKHWTWTKFDVPHAPLMWKRPQATDPVLVCLYRYIYMYVYSCVNLFVASPNLSTCAVCAKQPKLHFETLLFWYFIYFLLLCQQTQKKKKKKKMHVENVCVMWFWKCV